MKESGANVTFVHQDHLSGTALMTSANGTSLGTISYSPFGSTRSGSVPTDIKFTGQRLDATGLYYYGARYYDSNIGRFISPDPIVQSPANPQNLNRYSYVLNNPLKLVDPTGRYWQWSEESMMGIWYDDDYVPPAALTPEELRAVCDRGLQVLAPQVPLPLEPRGSFLDGLQTVFDVAGLIPGLGEAFDAANAVIYAARGDYVSAGLSAAAMIPVVGSVGTGAKLVGKAAKAIDKADDVADTLRGARNPTVKEALNRGRQAHIDEYYGPGVGTEVRLPSGKRMDGYNPVNRIVYELKPDNPRAINRGLAQLKTYVEEANKVFGPGHQGITRTYRK